MRSSLALAAALVAAFVLPAAALGGAEQIVDSWSDEPTPWELVDPCTGAELVGVGVESG